MRGETKDDRERLIKGGGLWGGKVAQRIHNLQDKKRCTVTG